LLQHSGVKMLFDQNVSPWLCQALAIRFGICDLGLREADDAPTSASGAFCSATRRGSYAAKEIPPGQPVTVCYGMRDADSVTLEPERRAMQPAEQQCFNLRPTATTTYTLVVSGSGGRTEREQITITVK
jgi:hypothetical protein